MAPARLSQEEVDRRNTVGIGAETVTNTTNTDIPGHYVGEDHDWDSKEFRKRLQIHFHYNKPYDASFSVVHITAPIANAFRRILLATLPTIAIERVFIYNNTSIIQDEVLAHRLGLVPLLIPPELLRHMHWPLSGADEDKDGLLRDGENQSRDEAKPFRDLDTLTLRLHMKCEEIEGVSKLEQDPLKLYKNAHVYARDLVWVPQGRQAAWLGIEGKAPEEIPEHLRVRPANPDILLAKMRPGQVIETELHAVKGCGADHAKFSPVATASYRLLPSIKILEPIVGDDALKFRDCFIPGVIELEKITAAEARKGGDLKVGQEKAVVKDPFRDTVSRECLRHDEFKNKVRLGRVRDHFIFSVESTGQYESDVLFSQSVRALKERCVALKQDLDGIAQ